MSTEDTTSGHVGGPLETVKFRLKSLPEIDYLITDKPYPTGELCIKGLNMFQGYFKDPEKTAEAHDQDGWFCTGDVATVLENGSIKILGRSEHMIKLSQGEKIAPEKIQAIICLSQVIDQCLVYGDSLKKSCVAVIIPRKDWVLKWGIDNKVEGTSIYMGKDSENKWFKKRCASPNFKKYIAAEIFRLATENNLSSHEIPKDIYISHLQFTAEERYSEE